MKKQNNEKLSDEAFARLALTSILGILVCIICLCSTTYTWFSGSVQVDSNTLKAAGACLLSVSVYKDGTEKAIILGKAAVAKVNLNTPLTPGESPVTKRALVIGGGIAGIQTALDIADAGFEVDIVEKKPTIGGKMAQH